MQRGVSIRAKISLMVLLICMICSLLIGGCSYIYLKDNLEKYMGAKARDIALTVSVNINGDQIRRYDTTGMEDDDYKTLTEYLTAVKSSANMTYLYIMTDDGENYKYIAEGGEDPALLGDTQSKTEYGPEPAATLETGQATYSEMYDNGEYGSLLSGFAPIKDSAGSVVAVVGLDIGTEIINESVLGFLPVITLIVAISCILSYTLILWVVSTLIIKPLKMIEKTSEKLSEYDFEIEIPARYIRKSDEMGRLFHTIKSMADDMKRIICDIYIVLSEMSSRNLNITTKVTYKGEFLPIKESIDTIIQAYNTIMSNCELVAENVTENSKKLSEISSDLADGSITQSSATEMLKASIIQIADSSQFNVNKVAHAKEYVANVDKDIALSNDKMTSLLRAMEDINETSVRINKIIKVIDDITFQTNLLALNAAVEAARAGAAGRGFSVVAEEVRALANKTAEAAKQTSALIGESQSAVHTGTLFAEETAAALEDVLKKTQLVTEAVDDISVASSEQAASISEIKASMQMICEVVVTNKAKAEESTASSQELSAQAQLLYRDLAGFILKAR